MVTDQGMIDVRINGHERNVPTGLAVADLLEWLDLNAALVVVELNREILDRARYGEIVVRENDCLELVHFVGGG